MKYQSLVAEQEADNDRERLAWWKDRMGVIGDCQAWVEVLDRLWRKRRTRACKRRIRMWQQVGGSEKDKAC